MYKSVIVKVAQQQLYGTKQDLEDLTLMRLKRQQHHKSEVVS